MKILVACPRIPAAQKKGDQVVSFHRVAYLAQNHSIQVLCFGRDENDLSDKRALEALGVAVHMVAWRKVDALWFGLGALLDRSVPFQCAFYGSHAFRRAFDNILREFNPDAVYAVTVRIFSNISSFEKPLYVDMVDSMGLNFGRRKQAARGLKKTFLTVEHERIQAFERKVAQMANRSFVVSELDRSYIGGDKVGVLPLGIDLSYFQRENAFAQKPIVVFSGNMNYQPNVEAVLWFVTFCWRAVKLSVPEARLVIAGSNPAPSVSALVVDSSITVTGRVVSMAAVLNASQVAVAPMQSGSGMQFKVLEAMACGVPVVATTIGLGDIGATVNEEILIGDTPEAITELVVVLLREASQRAKIGEAGFNYVVANHQWHSINNRFAKDCGFD